MCLRITSNADYNPAKSPLVDNNGFFSDNLSVAKKTSRILLHLVCTKCKNQNYITQKNKMNTTDKLGVKKYCKKCKEHTDHKESTKLK